MPDASGSILHVPEDLGGAGPFINGVSAAIDSELGQLRNQLTPISLTWTGAAKTWYEGLQQEWNMAAEGLFGETGVLTQIAHAMNINWNNYTDCEWTNLQSWKRH